MILLLPAPAIISAAPAGSDGNIQLFKGGEVSIAPGQTQNAVFDLPRKGVAELRFQGRSNAKKLAGMLSMLYVRVNGKPLSAKQLIGRKSTFKFRSGKKEFAEQRGRFTLYHAPSFEPLPKRYRYLPLDLPNHDPFTFRLDISPFVKPGKNTITFAHFKPHKRYTAIVVRNAHVAIRPLDDVLVERARKLKARAEKMRAVRLKLYDDVPTVADTPDMLHTLRNLRMTNWAYWNSGDLGEYPTPGAAARRAEEIKRSNATAAIVRGRHFRLHYLDETDRLMKYYETTARACHDQGLKCFAHFDFTLFWQMAFPLLIKNPQWPQRSLHDGTPTRWLCCNHPDLRERYAQYVEEIARRGIDGFMLDEINFIFKGHLHCGCEHCRRKFEEKTGYRLPETNDRAVIGNTRNPLWRLWQEWQMQTLAEFRLFLLNRMRKINPGVIILTYSTNIYFPTKSTGAVFENARVCFAGTEGSNLTWAGCANLYAQHRICRAFTSFWGRPTWAQYPTPSEEGRIFGSVFLAPVTGNGPWGWLRIYHGGSVARYCTWKHLEESFTYGDPVADVGVLLSTVNRYGPPERTTAHSAEVFGWLQAFGLRGVQFNPVPGKYAKWEHVQPYKALIVPDCLMLPKPTVDVVKRFVQEGGTAVVTGVPGRYDALYFPLGDESLLRGMGHRSVAAADDVYWRRKKQRFENGVDRIITLEPGLLPALPRQIQLPKSYRFDAVLKPSTRPAVLARFEDGAPAICSIPSGRGRYIYLGFLPGQLSYQHGMSQKVVVKRCHPPQVLDLMRAIAQEATGDSDRVSVAGKGIISSAWQRGNRVWVRMVNVSGAQQLPVGKPPGRATPVYPRLAGIRIRLRMPVKTGAKLFTPDRDESIPLKVRRDGTDHIISIPADTFKTFAFVRLEVAQ